MSRELRNESLTNIMDQMELDYWVISDRGSTDNTQQIIKKNLPDKPFASTFTCYLTNLYNSFFNIT